MNMFAATIEQSGRPREARTLDVRELTVRTWT
ncbi:hypothetical protein HNR73_007180 [Phytomonospora endophytica]|uniref:Uncharacterized protein n=1 Tax=Phytomonospora endophytica TaxID=714109 RepID=A0A841FTC5_9ACTN|nr:hypothetical protein [Phytomonospora endophytica]